MLLLDSLRDTFRDSHEAARELSESIEEHVEGPARVLPLGAGSRALACAVAERIGRPVSDETPSSVPRTVVIVAERIRRIRPVDSLMAKLLNAGAERIVIATPLAESSAAYAIDDRADAFVCLRRTARLGTIGRWYDHWTFATATPPKPSLPMGRPMLVHVARI
jgi:predicted phosphoribosyltransferase